MKKIYTIVLAILLVLNITGAVYAAQQHSDHAKACCKGGECKADCCKDCKECKDSACCTQEGGKVCKHQDGQGCCKDCGKEGHKGCCQDCCKKESKEPGKACCKK